LKKPIIEFKNVSKVFEDSGTVVLKDINFELEEGKFYTLLGASGSGKSTILNIIAGLLDATTGDVYLDGERINDVPTNKRDVHTVFQSYALFPHMTVFENVAFPLRLKKVDKAEIERRVSEVLKMVQLAGFEKRSIQKLSGGQRQRVAIARAIINEPRVVLLDEPLSALDLKLRTDMQYELRELQQRLGITFVFVTHDQEEALAMSDWIFVMNEGEIVQSGTPVDIYDEPINHFVATFIGESNILSGRMIEDYLVEFNGKRFEAVDGGMRPNEPVEVVIRPEDLQITLPEEGKLQVKVDTQLFRGVHYEIIAYDDLGNEWMIHSTRKAIVGEVIGLDFEPEDIHVMRLNETEEEFDARIEEYVEVEEQEAGLINALENYKEFFTSQNLTYLKMSFNSVLYAGIVTLVTLLISYPTAYFLTLLKHRQLWLMLIVLPTWVNLLLKAYAFIGIFGQNGSINSFLSFLGVAPQQILFTDFSFIFVASYIELPFMILPIFNVLDDLDPNLINASYDLGANRWDTFRHVVFPLSMNGVRSGVQSVFIPSLSLFMLTRMIGGNRVITLGTAIEQHFLTTQNWGMGSTIGVVLILAMLFTMWATRERRER